VKIRENYELETLFHKLSILKTIKNKRLLWAGHAWRSQNPLICIVLKENPTGKRLLGRPLLRWKDVVRNNVKKLVGYVYGRIQKFNGDNWWQGCMSGWFMWPSFIAEDKTHYRVKYINFCLTVLVFSYIIKV
jgi:hypothetical protein